MCFECAIGFCIGICCCSSVRTVLWRRSPSFSRTRTRSSSASKITLLYTCTWANCPKEPHRYLLNCTRTHTHIYIDFKREMMQRSLCMSVIQL